MSRYCISAIFAIAGLALLVVNTGNNVAEITRTEWAMDTVAVVVGLSIMAALLSLFLARIWGLSWVCGLVALTVTIGCAATSMRLTMDRIGGVDEDSKHGGRVINGRIQRADAEVERLQRLIESQRPIAARECRGHIEGRSDPKRWPNCLTAQGLIDQYEAGMATAKAERVKLGEAVTVERHSERFLGWVFGPNAGRASAMIQPVMIASLLEVGTALLLSIAGLFASSGGRRQPPIIDVTPIDPAVAVLKAGPLSNRQLAARLGWSESRASRHIQALASDGLVSVARDGKRKLIAAS